MPMLANFAARVATCFHHGVRELAENAVAETGAIVTRAFVSLVVRNANGR